ncbi:MAG: metallophosphoesterase [Clostridia bacterium]|nr:metallophosphoesterase [Clostridia bacterium]
MKRLLIFVLTLALLPITLLTPLSVSAAVEVTDALYEAPDMHEYDENWVIYDPEDKSRTLQCNQRFEMVDINNGTVAALNAPGKSTLIEFKAPYLAKNPISIEDYEYSELALRVQFYVSDATVLTSNCEMELTSSGTCDKLELNFGPHKQHKLQNGWNYMYLPFSEGAIKNGQLDVTNINYMRFYFFLEKEITMALGKIMIVPLEKIGVDATMSTQGWSATDATAADENGMLKMTVNGSGSISTSAYALPIYKPARTAFTFNVKTADPALIQSLTLQLTDVNGKTAKKNLDTKALKENMMTEFEVICSDLEAHEKFNFEFIKSITLIAQTTAQADLYFQKLLINSYDSDYFYDWVPGYTTEPGAYSIAVIPDIQELSAAYPHKLNTIMQWIADNKEKENIRFAIDLGDVTWNGHTGDTTSSHTEFANARNAFDILSEAGIEYSISYGNHDYTPTGRDTSIYNQYFPLELFQSFDSYAGTMDETKSDNTYFTFKGGNTDYLVIALEYTPDNKTISWANEIVTSHPNHKVIVTTHGYMQGDSAKTAAEENELAPAVGADRLWNNLLKKHENILMLLCGHAWSKSYSGDLVMRQDQGVNGNTVYQIMANAQDIDGSRGGVGMLLMLRFSEDGNVIDFHWFSPVSGETFRPNNQFTLAINNELSINGIEDEASYCGSASFTVSSLTSATVKVGSTVLQPDNGVYTIVGTDRPKTIMISDPFGDKMTSRRITVNKGHTGGTASCDAAALCEVCGVSYGDPLEHTFGEDGKCTACGADAPKTDSGETENAFSPLFLLPIAAAVIIAGVAVCIVLNKKKK